MKKIKGHCSCGLLIIKTLNTKNSLWKNGDKYNYLGESNTNCHIFRCKKCHEPIHETFKKEFE